MKSPLDLQVFNRAPFLKGVQPAVSICVNRPRIAKENGKSFRDLTLLLVLKKIRGIVLIKSILAPLSPTK